MQLDYHLGDTEFAQSKSLMPLRIKNAQGPYIISESGQRYIDLTSGWCVGNLGWNLPEIHQAVKNFDGPSYASPHFHYSAWEELAHLLKEMTPGELETSFRATGGTESIEIALQAAMIHTGRDVIIGIDDAYHGNSIAARGIVRSKGAYFNWRKLKTPLTEDSLNDLEKLLKDKKVAALVMEPIILNKGVHVPAQEFMAQVQDLCHRYGSLLIIDEVATGFGRTGKLFGCDHFGLKPDIICLAKALSNGAAAIGATVTTKEVGESLREKDFPYSTYGWHPLSVAASVATLKHYHEHWTEIEDNIRAVGEYLRQRLEGMSFRHQPEIRSMGLAIHLEFDDEDYPKEISERAFKNNLILSEGISLFPPLNLELKVAQEAMQILEGCLN